MQLEDIPLAPVSHTWPTSHSSNYTKLQPISHPTEGRRLSWPEHKQVNNRQACQLEDKFLVNTEMAFSREDLAVYLDETTMQWNLRLITL